jgi:hypothetical protein
MIVIRSQHSFHVKGHVRLLVLLCAFSIYLMFTYSHLKASQVTVVQENVLP